MDTLFFIHVGRGYDLAARVNEVYWVLQESKRIKQTQRRGHNPALRFILAVRKKNVFQP